MDAPFHFFGNGRTIDQIDIDVCIGPALLVTIPGSRNEIDIADLMPFADDLRRLRRLVLNTGWSRRWGSDDYFAAHPVLTPAAAAKRSGAHELAAWLRERAAGAPPS